MPFFVLISGYTARNYHGDARQVRRVVSTLVVPYLIVETSMQFITRHYTGEPDPMLILSPQWLTWFLAALFVWRLTTPIWRALKYPITTSFVISLTVGLFELPNVLSLPKILGFLPFYVIGMHMSREWFERLTQRRIRIVSAMILIAAFAICYRYSAGWETDWLLWKQRYDETPLSATALEGVVQRGELLAIGLLLTFAALSLVPKRRSWTTRLGGRTIYTDLLHGYVLLVLSLHFDVFNRVERFGVLAVIMTIVGAVILANLLMTAFVAKVFRPVFEPRLTWLFREMPPHPEAAKTTEQTATPDPASSKPSG
jgi:fucose 4-O-acetylase-like acetyltransferase